MAEQQEISSWEKFGTLWPIGKHLNQGSYGVLRRNSYCFMCKIFNLKVIVVIFSVTWLKNTK